MSVTDSLYLPQTGSTNDYLSALLKKNKLPEGFVVYTGYQTEGKGQKGNTWESANGENLLFSLLLNPTKIPLDEHFLLSQSVGLGIKKALDELTDEITVKWPNDIFWKDQKLAGILIETTLQGATFKSAVCGIGLNVNQVSFPQQVGNPVSLKQITDSNHSVPNLLTKIRKHILEIYHNESPENIRQTYFDSLYRQIGWHLFRDKHETFQARIADIRPDGQLGLQTKSGEIRRYYFKEVAFLTPKQP
ncbi:MAG: biotin--[acetyl-CoA-carboxylase] ligase [Prevotellaceae bacterium]|jgi:BirA family biotin operon repressor/biotin-[acetyl-CoA-carboxylase] ligase|nr:biotin--[acetyl-CoA-carboxylase] ligase [Prevotellaceae bacterium]